MSLFDQTKNNPVKSKCPICNETIEFYYSQLGKVIMFHYCKNTVNIQDNGLKTEINNIETQAKNILK